MPSQVSTQRFTDRTTYVYGLFDPLTRELRYVGKTVKTLKERLCAHVCHARTSARHNRHVKSWITSLERYGQSPEIALIEQVDPGSDWVEAEQFWIAYFRGLGARLCNHSSGGEGAVGVKQPPEVIEARISKSRGEKHYNYGKTMKPHVKEALAAGSRALRADPIRYAEAQAKRLAGLTPEIRERLGQQLQNWRNDPKNASSISAVAVRRSRTPEARARVGQQSSDLWATKRDEIIAAQNAGKDAEWKRKQSEAKKATWATPGNKMAAAMKRRRKITTEDVAEITRRVAAGESQLLVAQFFGIDRSLVSRISRGERRYD